jgi:hypothetical protein
LDEKVFHATLKKIRWSTNRDDLASATRTTLQLLLRRPTDQKLLNSLFSQLDSIVGRLSSGKGDNQSAEIRQAAVRCVVLLQSAKRGRLTRSQQNDLTEKGRHRRMLILLVATAATVAFYFFLIPQRNTVQPGHAVAAAIQDALKTTRLGLTRRDNVTIRATHDHTVVTAERLTPDDCIAAAREVQTMGEISINDTAVGRPNDSKFNTLCSQMGDATLTVTVNQYRKR